MSAHFNETELAELITRCADYAYKNGNRDGFEEESGWDNAYQSMCIKLALWRVFSVGDECYNRLKCLCSSRGYPVGYVMGTLSSVVSFVNDSLSRPLITGDDKGYE